MTYYIGNWSFTYNQYFFCDINTYERKIFHCQKKVFPTDNFKLNPKFLKLIYLVIDFFLKQKIRTYIHLCKTKYHLIFLVNICIKLSDMKHIGSVGSNRFHLIGREKTPLMVYLILLYQTFVSEKISKRSIGRSKCKQLNYSL